MARKRTLDLKTLRAQADAAEAREKEDVEETEEEPVEADAEASDDDGGDDDEKPKAKAKKKAAPKKKATTVKRTRAPKEPPRMKAIWVVFDNGSKRVKEFAYPNKADAEAFMAEKIEEKKATYYITLVKEPLTA